MFCFNFPPSHKWFIPLQMIYYRGTGWISKTNGQIFTVHRKWMLMFLVTPRHLFCRHSQSLTTSQLNTKHKTTVAVFHTWGSHRWPAGETRSSWRCCGWLWRPGSASWSQRWLRQTRRSSPPWTPGSEQWIAGGGSSLENKNTKNMMPYFCPSERWFYKTSMEGKIK